MSDSNMNAVMNKMVEMSRFVKYKKYLFTSVLSQITT